MKTDATRFVDAVLPGSGSGIIYAHKLHPKGMSNFRTLHGLHEKTDCYWSIALFPWAAGERTKARALGVRALVIDDVETKVSGLAVEMALGAPTAIVETSRNNYQWTYRLAKLVPVAEWDKFFAEVERRIGMPLDGKDAVHLFRLPMGVNTRKDNFAVRLEMLDPARELDAAEIMAKAPAAAPAAPWTAGAADKMELGDLRKLMELVPNIFDDRDTWVEIGHGIKALCENDADGFTIFDEWSQTHSSYDAEETRRVWDSFGVSGLRSRGGMLRDRAEKSKAFAQEAFNDGMEHPKRKGIKATLYKWMDLNKIPPRDWLYGDILIRRFISMTVAPGGVGKSSLTIAETLAQVTGRDLLGEEPAGELRVWMWNLEDPYTETQLRIQAAAKHYKISEADIGDRLYVDSGRDQRLVIADMGPSGPKIVRPVVEDLVAEIKARQIDIVVVDPFVSCHGVPENDNMAQDMVVKEWGRVAELGNCAVHLVDHTRKAGAEVEVTTESSRGAKSKTDAARVVRVVNRMTATDGKVYGLGDTWRYFNTFNDKANMAPPKARRSWFRMESILAENGGGAAAAFSVGAAAVPVSGDSVGVAVQWFPPSAQILATGDSYTKVIAAMGTKKWRREPRSPDWVGHAVAQGLQLSASSISGRGSIKDLIEKWISDGLFIVLAQTDEYRKTKEYIEIAKVF